MATTKRQTCGLCGRDPATGYALIGDVRYCHGDEDPEPTCYMRAQWEVIQGPHTGSAPTMLALSHPSELGIVYGPVPDKPAEGQSA